VIATTGCLGGHVLQSLMRRRVRGALDKAGRLQEIFGRGQPLRRDPGPRARERSARHQPQADRDREAIGAPLLATNDSHYTHRHDHVAHDALLCVQTGALMSDPKRFKFDRDEHYLKTAEEMRYLFREVPEVACDNTLWIAERADVEIEFGERCCRTSRCPEGSRTTRLPASPHVEGAKLRWGDPLPDAVIERLAYELRSSATWGSARTSSSCGTSSSTPRTTGIRVGPGRGSAAGCAVAYTPRITDLDPIKYDLLFERFLNPSRISMPDIDMDFDSRYRDEMIRTRPKSTAATTSRRSSRSAQIKARNAAVRDAARVLGYPYGVGDKVAKAMPPLVMGRDTPLKCLLRGAPKYADGYKGRRAARHVRHGPRREARDRRGEGDSRG
jgi:DNA polymerase-3 subunit alpha